MPQDPRMIRSSPCLVLSQEMSQTGSQTSILQDKDHYTPPIKERKLLAAAVDLSG